MKNIGGVVGSCIIHIILIVIRPFITNYHLFESFFKLLNLLSMIMVEANLVGATESNFNELKLLNINNPIECPIMKYLKM